jgi:hypothetical protein
MVIGCSFNTEVCERGEYNQSAAGRYARNVAGGKPAETARL